MLAMPADRLRASRSSTKKGEGRLASSEARSINTSKASGGLRPEFLQRTLFDFSFEFVVH